MQVNCVECGEKVLNHDAESLPPGSFLNDEGDVICPRCAEVK